MICLQVPTPDALTRPSDMKGYLQCGNSRTLKARAFLDLLVFCGPSPPDYMRVVSGTGRGALAMFFASHELPRFLGLLHDGGTLGARPRAGPTRFSCPEVSAMP
jgi:hypothetical protein